MSDTQKKIHAALTKLLKISKTVPVNPSAPNREPWETRLLNAIYAAEIEIGRQT